ncbi:NAD(P)-dependent oxidoreductase [Actinoplanes bogorensis]|uniref:NAD(P)-dependent oxidoreductase n=1 Tax=Paractinoplanes bogorensis TaxID=1610840 RepID=A0ABS5YSI4_9ACTN|nr:NAD(P)-dependent oxidoreductase [Actinoplanes bogorensis]MBU2666395.1 NAD(P)-dependent oxidoreductase [Actinoplanes bogorensis]
MARIAVTGGSGKLGRAVVKDLLDHGNDVVNLDQAGGADPRARWTKTDLSDFGQAVGALTGVDDRYDKVDAVVHLAAIPAPGLLPNAATFHNNITVTYNVFAAARTAGIKKIVWASSETVLGLPFEETPPPYLPADEEYPARPNSSYSLAKHLEEQMAAQFCRWDPTLTMIGLRFSNVMEPDDYRAFAGYDEDPHMRSWNAWGYIDARDGAQAVRRSLAYGETGLEVFVIANADTVMSRSSASLAAEVFPDLPLKKDLGEHETLLSIDKARRLLGYEPEYTWR